MTTNIQSLKTSHDGKQERGSHSKTELKASDDKDVQDVIELTETEIIRTKKLVKNLFIYFIFGIILLILVQLTYYYVLEREKDGQFNIIAVYIGVNALMLFYFTISSLIKSVNLVHTRLRTLEERTLIAPDQSH